MRIVRRLALITLGVAALQTSPVAAQQCVPDAAKTPEQVARRQDGVRAARTINNLEANQPGNRSKKYLSQSELASSPFAAQQTGAAADFFKKLNFTPGAELMPGWELRLDVTGNGYWFSIKDKTDPCGLTFISNQQGLILEAQPIR
jgi:hypothetical protein